MLYFSHVKKAYTANQNDVQLFFTCESITNQRCKGLCSPVCWVENRDKSRKSTKLGTDAPFDVRNEFRRDAT